MKTDKEIRALSTFTEGVNKAAQAINRLAGMGEPFPRLEQCLKGGQSPWEILESVEAAIADCEDVDGFVEEAIAAINDAEEPCWYEFTAYNSQAIYGYGTKDVADRYCDHLNKGREINVYGYSIAEGSNEDYCDHWFNLDDELAAIAEERSQ